MTAPPAGARPPAPRATYRLQLGADLRFADVGRLGGYLRRLGVSHVYLSPVLEAAPGSTHGYDAVDQSLVSRMLGGEEGLRAAANQLAHEGIAIVVDVVPNHVAIPVPEYLNRQVWSLLEQGPDSPYSDWFDVHWSEQGQVLMPVLDQPLAAALADGELTIDPVGGPGGEPVLRYRDHAFPIRPGSEGLDLAELADAQYYRLAAWQRGNDEVNYRRFFDVDTLVGIRVERPEVFDAAHATLLRLRADGVLAGFRIDHVDGLADPRGYLVRLAEQASPGTWTVVEKILLGDEQLPGDWAVDGTTGYDALARIGALFVHPGGAEVLRKGFTDASGEYRSWTEVEQDARRYVLTTLLGAEVDRLAVLALDICGEDPDVGQAEPSMRALVDALVELLVHLPVYRIYVVPGQPTTAQASSGWAAVAVSATEHSPHRAAEIELVRALALGEYGRSSFKDEFVRRLQQTCGPAVAKGVEDTAAYRWTPLAALNEVGARPDEFGLEAPRFHAWAADRAARWPLTMNALTTHDTKRGEDVRACITALSEAPERWLDTVAGWTARLLPDDTRRHSPDATTSSLLWQTMWGAWPIDGHRLSDYLRKAAREAKQHTSWLVPDGPYESALAALAEAALADDLVRAELAELRSDLRPAVVANTLGFRALQLMLPGLPDLFQGSEAMFLRLVDPDNRVTPNWCDLADRLDAALAEVPDPESDLGGAKMRLTALGLQVRRDHAPAFGEGSAYLPLTGHGPAARHLIGFCRGRSTDLDVASVAVTVTRWAVSLAGQGGWRDTVVDVPAGHWRDVLTGTDHEIGAGSRGVSVAALHARWPLAVLVRTLGPAGPARQFAPGRTA